MGFIKTFIRSADGSVSTIVAILAPVLFGVTALAIEVGRMNNAKSVAQAAGDAAAIAAARESTMAGSKLDVITALATETVERFVSGNVGQLKVQTATEVTNNPVEVRVTVSTDLQIPFGALFGRPAITISTLSVAQVIGKPNVCILGLDKGGAGIIHLGGSTTVLGNNCSAFSNSTDRAGISSAGGGKLSASTICSAGGFSGPLSSFMPQAISDCPTFKDPLIGRSAPQVAANCTGKAKKINGASVTLQPGTYCGGLTIGNHSSVTLAPGIYVIKDGPFEVGTKSTLTGSGVGLYFTGENSSIRFKNDSNISLRAPVDGPMAGLLAFSDRGQSATTEYVINSENARVLVGTIYLPNGHLVIDSPKTVGDLSEYTAIVAREVEFRQGNVVLNTDYGRTDVPVPEGIGSLGQPVALYR
jgi:Flp pilus assembly protein TadG